MRRELKWIIGMAITFFLALNTIDWWSDNLGFFAMVFTTILFFVYIILSITLIILLLKCIKERFRRKDLNVTVGILIFVTVTSYLMPYGIVNLNSFKPKDVLIAHREGVANCTVTLKLKEIQAFTFSSICFGTSLTKGDFIIVADTIFFNNVRVGRGQKDFYEYAIFDNENQLKLYKNRLDTLGYPLVIVESMLLETTF